MLIDFNNLERKHYDNFKGGEKYVDAIMFADDNNRLMHGILEPGASIGLHRHEGTSEAIYILKGKAKALYDGREEILGPGMCHYCEEGHEHTLINEGVENVEYFAMIPCHK